MLVVSPRLKAEGQWRQRTEGWNPLDPASVSVSPCRDWYANYWMKVRPCDTVLSKSCPEALHFTMFGGIDRNDWTKSSDWVAELERHSSGRGRDHGWCKHVQNAPKGKRTGDVTDIHGFLVLYCHHDNYTHRVHRSHPLWYPGNSSTHIGDYFSSHFKHWANQTILIKGALLGRMLSSYRRQPDYTN